MSWVIYILVTFGFLSIVGTAGVLFAAWACHEETDEDAANRHDDIEGGTI